MYVWDVQLADTRDNHWSELVAGALHTVEHVPFCGIDGQQLMQLE